MLQIFARVLFLLFLRSKTQPQNYNRKVKNTIEVWVWSGAHMRPRALRSAFDGEEQQQAMSNKITSYFTPMLSLPSAKATTIGEQATQVASKRVKRTTFDRTAGQWQ